MALRKQSVFFFFFFFFFFYVVNSLIVMHSVLCKCLTLQQNGFQCLSFPFPPFHVVLYLCQPLNSSLEVYKRKPILLVTVGVLCVFIAYTVYFNSAQNR